MEEQKNKYPVIHPDLVAVILSRLPLESLKRFIFVCKRFGDLISNPGFVKLHHEQSMKEAYLLASSVTISHFTKSVVLARLDMQSYEARNPNRELIADEDSSEELDYLCPISCDIICFATTESKIYVCNLSIDRIKLLPKPSNFTSKYSKIGFVYSSSTKEYKVVHLFSRQGQDGDRSEDKEMECETFTFGFHRKVSSSSWMTTREQCPCLVYYKSVSTDGRIYWLIRDKTPKPFSNDLIVSFDSVTESFQIISRPPTWPSKNYKNSIELMAVEGNLCITDVESKRRTLVLDVWMLRENSSWELFYSINLSTTFGSLCDEKMFIPQCIYRGDILFMQDIFSNDPYRTEVYSIEKNTFRRLYSIDQVGISWESLFDVCI